MLQGKILQLEALANGRWRLYLPGFQKEFVDHHQMSQWIGKAYNKIRDPEKKILFRSDVAKIIEFV